ncbi:MAG: hypothetical protein AAGG75_11150 [Bacteroidota bacterium]
MKGHLPSKKKITYPTSPALEAYLNRYNRNTKLPLQYEDLLRYQHMAPLLDLSGNDTLWETVYYSESDRQDIHRGLKLIYALLKTEGDVDVMEHLEIARIDFCTFGNTKPFRVRIINKLNDNYDHFYIKRSDASRIYGLELEHILSPNRVTYLANGNTLIEEHIAGIPGDDFMKNNLNDTPFNQIRIAKEFVKFNERCFVRLLGDMRSYNYVIDITPDIEGSQFRLRTIDFDQQSYEGRKNFYLPQYFKDNNPIIFLGINHMTTETVRQYQQEERSLIAVRAKTSHVRLNALLDVMINDEISPPDKVEQLKQELSEHHKNDTFLNCQNMGELVKSHIRLLLSKDFTQSSIVWEPE